MAHKLDVSFDVCQKRGFGDGAQMLVEVDLVVPQDDDITQTDEWILVMLPEQESCPTLPLIDKPLKID